MMTFFELKNSKENLNKLTQVVQQTPPLQDNTLISFGPTPRISDLGRSETMRDS